jgi:hypothetical protein
MLDTEYLHRFVIDGSFISIMLCSKHLSRGGFPAEQIRKLYDSSGPKRSVWWCRPNDSVAWGWRFQLAAERKPLHDGEFVVYVRPMKIHIFKSINQVFGIYINPSSPSEFVEAWYFRCSFTSSWFPSTALMVLYLLRVGCGGELNVRREREGASQSVLVGTTKEVWHAKTDWFQKNRLPSYSGLQEVKDLSQQFVRWSHANLFLSDNVTERALSELWSPWEDACKIFQWNDTLRCEWFTKMSMALDSVLLTLFQPMKILKSSSGMSTQFILESLTPFKHWMIKLNCPSRSTDMLWSRQR